MNFMKYFCEKVILIGQGVILIELKGMSMMKVILI